jgi:hypothetical protein
VAPKNIPENTLIVVPPDLPAGGKVQLYAIPYDVYTDKKYLMEPAEAGVVRELVKYGAALAYMPSSGIGIGTMCYLANLRSLRT